MCKESNEEISKGEKKSWVGQFQEQYYKNFKDNFKNDFMDNFMDTIKGTISIAIYSDFNFNHHSSHKKSETGDLWFGSIQLQLK